MSDVHAAAGNHLLALRDQEQSLAIARELFAESGNSWFMGRTLVISLLRTGQIASQAGDEPLASARFTECRMLLQSLQDAGTELDPPMRRLLEQLAA